MEKKGGRKRDNVRIFFEEQNGDKLHCNINNCTKIFSKKTSVYALRDHVKHFHNNIVCKNSINNNNININMNDESKNINNIIENNDKQEDKINHLFALAFAKNSLPYSLLDDTVIPCKFGKKINHYI